MSILQSIFATAENMSISDFVNPRWWLSEAAAGSTTQAGLTINTESAMAISTYYACLRAISEDVARLPLIVYKARADRGKDRHRTHYLYPILHDSPNNFMSSMSLREALLALAMGWGDAYAVIRRNAMGKVAELIPVHTRNVTPKTNGERLWYEITKDNFFEGGNVLSSEMIHIHGLGESGIQGHSIAKLGAESLGLTLAAETYGASFFGHHTQLSGILEHPMRLEDDAFERLKASWSEKYAGPGNAYHPVVLEEGMQWKPVGIPPEDSQMLETRQFQVEEICRWFRITPHKVQHLKDATYSNVEKLATLYVNDTLAPWISRCEQEFNRKLFPREADVFCEHLVEGMLRGDSEARGKFYRELFHIGAMSPNDIRELENRNPVEGGDTYYVPANMMRSEDAAEGTPAAVEPVPAQPASGGAPQPGTGRAAEGDFLAAQMPILEDVAGRILRKETKAARRAYGKHKANWQTFETWMRRFLLEQRAYVVETLLPVVSSMAYMADNGHKAPKAMAEAIADWHVGNTETRLAGRFDRDLEAELDDWEGRAGGIVNQICEVLNNDS